MLYNKYIYVLISVKTLVRSYLNKIFVFKVETSDTISSKSTRSDVEYFGLIYREIFDLPLARLYNSLFKHFSLYSKFTYLSLC